MEGEEEGAEVASSGWGPEHARYRAAGDPASAPQSRPDLLPVASHVLNKREEKMRSRCRLGDGCPGGVDRLPRGRRQMPARLSEELRRPPPPAACFLIHSSCRRQGSSPKDDGLSLGHKPQGAA